MTGPHVLVERILTRLMSCSPWFKLILYLHVLAIGIWAPVVGVGIVGGAGFLLLLIYRGHHGLVGDPKWIVAFCVFAVGIAVPWGTAAMILQASEFAVRMLTVMTATGIAAICSSIEDLLLITHDLRMPHFMRFLLVALYRYLATAVNLFNNVMVAQRSRGLRFDPQTVFSGEGYRALAVPYSLAIIRSIDSFWISMNMRPGMDGIVSKSKVTVGELTLLFSSLGFWLAG